MRSWYGDRAPVKVPAGLGGSGGQRRRVRRKFALCPLPRGPRHSHADRVPFPDLEPHPIPAGRRCRRRFARRRVDRHRVRLLLRRPRRETVTSLRHLSGVLFCFVFQATGGSLETPGTHSADGSSGRRRSFVRGSPCGVEQRPAVRGVYGCVAGPSRAAADGAKPREWREEPGGGGGGERWVTARPGATVTCANERPARGCVGARGGGGSRGAARRATHHGVLGKLCGARRAPRNLEAHD